MPANKVLINACKKKVISPLRMCGSNSLSESLSALSGESLISGPIVKRGAVLSFIVGGSDLLNIPSNSLRVLDPRSNEAGSDLDLLRVLGPRSNEAGSDLDL